MFGFGKKQAVQELPVSVVLVPEVQAIGSTVSFPVDSQGLIIFLNDTVEYANSEYQVVAMSHRNKVVIRKHGETSGGRWVKASSVTLVRRVLGER